MPRIADLQVALIDLQGNEFRHAQTRMQHLHHCTIALASGEGSTGSARRCITSSWLNVFGIVAPETCCGDSPSSDSPDDPSV